MLFRASDLQSGERPIAQLRRLGYSQSELNGQQSLGNETHTSRRKLRVPCSSICISIKEQVSMKQYIPPYEYPMVRTGIEPATAQSFNY